MKRLPVWMKHGAPNTRNLGSLMILSWLCAIFSASPILAEESVTPGKRNLLSDCQSAALGIVENLESCEAALESQGRLHDAELKLKIKAIKASSDIKLKGAEQRIEILKGALEAARKEAERETWEHPGWWFAGGAVAGLAMTTAVFYGSVWAISKLRLSESQ
jgi:hypothetical protein